MKPKLIALWVPVVKNGDATSVPVKKKDAVILKFFVKRYKVKAIAKEIGRKPKTISNRIRNIKLDFGITEDSELFEICSNVNFDVIL